MNIVYSFGGDIIKIAGDALYCVFMPDEHDLRGAVLCAALCSMQLREVICVGCKHQHILCTESDGNLSRCFISGSNLYP